MNRVEIIGNLTDDPRVSYTSDQTPCARFTVAVNKGRAADGRDLGANFIPVVVWRKLALSCEKHLKKGKKVGICGQLTSGRYESEGRTIYTLDVTAEKVEFLSPREETQQTLPGFEPADDLDF